MAIYNIGATLGGTTPPYATLVGYMNTKSSWANIISTDGNYSGPGTPAVMFGWGGGDGDLPWIGPLYHVDMVFNLSSLGSKVITAATITMTTNSTTPMNWFYGVDAWAGIALVGQDETYRVGTTPATDDYKAIYQGRTNEFAQRITRNELIGSTSHTFTFNSAGLAYLNTVNTKGLWTNYACLGICYGAIVDGGMPNLSIPSGSEVAAYFPAITLNLTTGASFGQLNIGDAWKDIEEVKINIGDTWKDVEEWKINIGDVWKDPI